MKYWRYIKNLFRKKSKNKTKLSKRMDYKIIYYNNVIDLGFNIIKEYCNIPLYLKDFDLSTAFTNFLNENYAENGRVHENKNIDDVVKLVKSTMIPYIASNIIVNINIYNEADMIELIHDIGSGTSFSIQHNQDGYNIKIKLSFKDIYNITAKANFCENSCYILKDIIENYSDKEYLHIDSCNLIDIEDTDMSCNIAITKESIYINDELSNGDILVGVDTYSEDINMNNVYILTKCPTDRLLYSNSINSIESSSITCNNGTYYLCIVSIETIDRFASMQNSNTDMAKEIYQKALNHISKYNTDMTYDVIQVDDYSGIDEVLD